MFKATVMPFSYNLNTYSRNTLEQWLSVLYHDLYLSEEFQNFFEQEKMVLHDELNPFPGYLKLASSDFFNPEKDFFYTQPGELMQALSCGMDTRKIMATAYGFKSKGSSDNIFSPVYFYDEDRHLLTATGQQDFHASMASGTARSLKIYQSDGIVVCNLNAAQLNNGTVYEALLASDTEKLPVVFYIHGYDESHSPINPDLFGRLKNTYLSFCDNTNLFDTVNAARKATHLCRDERLPVIVVAKGELSPEQIFESYTALLVQSGKYDKGQIHTFGNGVFEEIKKAMSLVKSFEVTAPADLIRQTAKIVSAKEKKAEESTQSLTLLGAMREAFSQKLSGYRHSFMLTPTQSDDDELISFLKSKSASQVLELPFNPGFLISSGAGMGIYKKSLRTIIRLPGSGTALTESINHLTELAFLSWKSKSPLNMLVSMPVNGYDGSGPFRSHKPETMLLSIPGINVLYPSFADDAAGLLRTAFKSPGITVMLESTALHNDKLSITAIHPEHEVMIGKSRLLRQGQDITFVTWGNATHLAMKAAEKLLTEYNQQAEVVDLRSLLPLDKAGILRSIRKTHRALVVSESYLFAGTAADIAAMAGREAFTSLVAPITRVGTQFTPVPYQKEAESMALPSVNRIMDEALEILEY